jgi:acid phosphatase type 7
MKKSAGILSAAAALLLAAFLIWAFVQHGTIGLFRVNSYYRNIFIAVGVIDILFIVISLFLVLSQKIIKRFVLILILIAAIPGISVPLYASIVLKGFPAKPINVTKPSLLLTDVQGKHGVPDIAVVFYSEDKKHTTLKWGEIGTSDELIEEDSAGQHIFIMEDLKPAAEYKYQINNGTEYYFTAPPIDGSIHFAVASDAHFGAEKSRPDLTEQMLNIIAYPSNNYEAFFFVGDMVEFGFSDAQWNEALNIMTKSTSTIPAVYTAGNHDTLFGGFERCLKYLTPQIQDSNDKSRLWSRIDDGNIHFIILDVEWSAETFTTAQAEWLENELASIPQSDWVIVMSHGYYYASGRVIDGWNWYDNPETIAAVTPLFEKYQVDMVFSGHLHQMEALEHNGVNYVICGTFGGHPEPEPEFNSPASIWYGGGGYGFVETTINGDKAQIVFRNQEYEILHSLIVTNNQ